jgi:hypothetical protein
MAELDAKAFSGRRLERRFDLSGTQLLCPGGVYARSPIQGGRND